MAVLSETNLRPTRWLKNQTNKKTKKKKKKKESKRKQNKNKNKTKQNKTKKARSTDLRLTALFFTLQQPSLSKWLRLKWQVEQSLHQARSHDLFWKGVGAPTKAVDFLD